MERMVVIVALVASGCEQVRVDLTGRACGGGGACSTSFVCHPENNTCVPRVDVDCTSAAGTCPERVKTGDACPAPGSFLPCDAKFDDCTAGCRPCRDDGTWGPCTSPRCVLGEVWSCSACTDDCRDAVLHAAPTCVGGRCDYTGSCAPGWIDANGERRDGCECTLSGVERCDGSDNDCNGVVDDGFGVGGGCGVGACAGGVRECGPTGLARCSTMPGGSDDRSTPEVCNGEDDDCSGTSDDNLICTPGAALDCDTGAGPATGLRTCQASSCDWGPCVADWWDPAWRWRVEIGVDTTRTTIELLHAPVLVVLDAGSVAHYSDIAPGGADLRFVAADGATVLSHEIESWDAAGTSYVWVRLPRIRPSPALESFFLYWGNAAAADRQNPEAVWDAAYTGVWHFSAARRYLDSTVRANDGAPDQLSADYDGRVAGGQGFAADGGTLRVPGGGTLGINNMVTVEVSARATGNSWPWTREVRLGNPTPRDDFQVYVLLPAGFDYGAASPGGADLRFFEEDGTPAPHFVERWVPGGQSTLWVRVPTAGTSVLRMYYGNSNAPNTSDPAAVFDFYDGFDTLNASRWRVDSGPTGHSLAGGVLRLNVGAVGLVSQLPFVLSDGYIVETSVFFHEAVNAYSGVAPAICSDRYVTASNVNAASTAFVMRNNNSSTQAYIWYGSGSATGYTAATAWTATTGAWHTAAASFSTTGVVVWFNGAFSTSIGVTWQKPLRWLSLGAFHGDAAYNIADTSYDWVRVRKHGTLTTPTLGPATATTVSQLGRLGLALVPGATYATVGDVTISGAAATGWRNLALTYDGVAVRLFVDGTPVASGAQPAGLGASSHDLLIGALLGLAGDLDEVRLSSTARGADWLALQHHSTAGTLLQYATVEER